MSMIRRFACPILIVSLWGLALLGWAYDENFDDGVADGWVVASGKWKVEEGAYIQEEGTPGLDNARNRASGFAVGDANWVDYTFEVKIKPLDASNYAGVMFRVNKLEAGGDGNTFGNLSEYYYWLIGIGGDYSRIWQAPLGQLLDPNPGHTLVANEWNEVKVEIVGQNVKLYLNGELEKDFDFPKAVQIASGGIALATYNAKAAFDDVRVRGDGIPQSVDDAGKLVTLWANMKAELPGKFSH